VAHRSSENPVQDPAPRRPLTARGEATKQRLLDSAERLFGANGFHATAVGDITRAAGVAQGTFYLYFSGKEEIFRELVRHLSRQLRRALQQATEGLCDRIAIEEAGVRAFLRFAAAHRDLYGIVFESQTIDPPLFRWYYERLAQGYSRGLSVAMERGEIPRAHAETMAYCLMGASHFLGMRWVVWEGREPPPEAMDAMLTFVRQALTPAVGAGMNGEDA
jgi:AcrR family transcriptional regulator